MFREGATHTAGTQTAASEPWQRLLDDYETVSLEGVADIVTSDRIDTKFLLRDVAVLEALRNLADAYRVLDIDGRRFSTYRTQYFDTASFALFGRHHAAASNRYKVRTRTYLNTDLSYVEVKRRTPRGTTSKLRQQTSAFERELAADARAFVDAHCSHRSDDLLPVLLNHFDRICFVGKSSRERLTIDLDVELDAGDGRIRLPGIAVAEFKQERNGHDLRDAAFLKRMRALRIRSTGFSKYCIGLLLARPEIKHNLFKPQLKRLHRLMEEPHVIR